MDPRPEEELHELTELRQALDADRNGVPDQFDVPTPPRPFQWAVFLLGVLVGWALAMALWLRLGLG